MEFEVSTWTAIIGAIIIIGWVVFQIFFTPPVASNETILKTSTGRMIWITSEAEITAKLIGDTQVEVQRHDCECPPQLFDLPEGNNNIRLILRY